ncbi:F-box/FBD/LRR-repeat protein [Cardamine amara subsp. amara]|uniref:F-box/FBD/LRR-repeat protein n=1 Tax=Cardamine amara subsp. amara TaxID=228776 RepID=A0ABD1AIL7_CARAN
MGGRKKKAKVCDKVSVEDRISQLPDSLIAEILCYLSTKDAVRTSVLSTRWRNLWQSVPELDLHPCAFSDVNCFVSFAERFFDPQREFWIRKLQLRMYKSLDDKSSINRWIDAVSRRRIKYLKLSFDFFDGPDKILPLSIFTCQTLVQLYLFMASLVNAEVVSLPCLKIIDLEEIIYPNEAILEKLISGPPLLEDLRLIGSSTNNAKVLQVRSKTLKRIEIDQFRVVIDAPLLQILRTNIYSTKEFEIINLGFFAKLEIDVVYGHGMTFSTSLIHGILTDISRVKDLVLINGGKLCKEIFLYSKSGPVLQFCNLSHLKAEFCKSDLEKLPTLLESCPKLESLILEVVKDVSTRGNKKPKVMFSKVPQCLVSSLKLVELKRSTSGYEGEIELVRYFLKNSTILKKLKLNVYYTRKGMCAFLKEVNAMPRCSTACEVLVL